MKHVVNDRSILVEEMIEGLVAAYNGQVERVPETNGIVRTSIDDNKVALVVGGGSGHEPIYHGLVGNHMADAAAIGNIFASPNPEVIYKTAKAAHRGNGILFFYGNYAGDNMNFDIAAEMLEDEGIQTKTVRINDDVASDNPEDRRGISGLVFGVKIAGAACAQAKTLDEAYAAAKSAVDNTRSMGVALQAGVMLNTQEQTFELGDDEMEIGMGVHGEPGVERSKVKPADEIVDSLMERILGDLPFKKGDETALVINDMGSITNMELLIVNRRISQILNEKGIRNVYTHIGKLATTMDMKGFSISLIRLNDELKKHLFLGASSAGIEFYDRT